VCIILCLYGCEGCVSVSLCLLCCVLVVFVCSGMCVIHVCDLYVYI